MPPSGRSKRIPPRGSSLAQSKGHEILQLFRLIQPCGRLLLQARVRAGRRDRVTKVSTPIRKMPLRQGNSLMYSRTQRDALNPALLPVLRGWSPKKLEGQTSEFFLQNHQTLGHIHNHRFAHPPRNLRIPLTSHGRCHR